MATRKGKLRPNRPPVKRRSASRTTALSRRVTEGEVLTLADIAKIKKQGRVRGGLMPRTTGEYGASGTLNVYGRIFGEDYNLLFDGKNGLAIFDQMDRSDGQVGAAGDIIKLPIRAATWRAEPPAEATQKEKDIAESVNEALFENNDWPRGESWDFYLRHLLMRVTHGFGCLEKIWMFDEDTGVLRWRRLAPRLPRTVSEFMPNQDGSLKEIVQYVSTPGTGRYDHRRIPAEYAVISVREREGDNYFGRSIYRRLYKHWFYKDEAYRIDGIRLDRFGVGIPVAKIEEGHVLESDELTEIELVLQALRSHERAYIIEPPKVTFRIMVPGDGHGGVSGLIESVSHHDTMIVRGVLATFMADHAEGLNTNRTRTLADIFLHALKSEASAVSGDVMSQAVRPYCDVNFDMSDARYPVITVTGMGDLTIEQLAAALGSLTGTDKPITAEDTLEDSLRKAMGLPPLPAGWRRGETKPAAPLPGAGFPPQSGQPPNAGGQPPKPNGTGKPAAVDNQGGAGAQEPNIPAPSKKQAKQQINADLLELSRDAYVRDDIGRFATTGGGGAASAGGGAPSAGPGMGDTGLGTHGTPESRSSNVMTAAEKTDPKFHDALATVMDANANDPNVSDFEKANPVAAARAAREAQRPFEELHAGGSQAYYRDANGNYTMARQELHDHIVGQYLSKFGPPNDAPTAVFLGGLASAGKSETLGKVVPDLKTPGKWVNLSSDDIKGMLPEYNGLNAGWLHEESDHVAKKILNRAVAAKQNIVVDVTMKSVGQDSPNIDDGVGGQVRGMVDKGYDVKMHFIEISLKQSGDGAMKRFVNYGRYVPPAYIRKAAASDPAKSSKNMETFEHVRSLPGVSGWTHLDRRNKSAPVLKTGGKP